MSELSVLDGFVVEPDRRWAHFIGGFDDSGVVQPMTHGALRRQTERWPRSSKTPTGIAGLLETSRHLFTQAYFHYEFLVVATLWSLHAVEAALRTVHGGNATFEKLIDQAFNEGKILAEEHDRLQAGRRLRNQLTHAVGQSTWAPGMNAGVVLASHEIVSKLFPDEARSTSGAEDV